MNIHLKHISLLLAATALLVGAPTAKAQGKPPLLWANRDVRGSLPVAKPDDNGIIAAGFVDQNGATHILGTFDTTWVQDNGDGTASTNTLSCISATRLNANGVINWQNFQTNAWSTRPGLITADKNSLPVYTYLQEFVSAQSVRSFDWHIRKVNGSGNTMWDFILLTSYEDTTGITALSEDADGNVLAAGYTTGDYSGKDYFIAKVSTNGVVLWEQSYSGAANNDDVPSGITSDLQGNVFVTGTSTDPVLGANIATIKYDPNGSRLWVKYYNNAASLADSGLGIAIDVAGNAYVCGKSQLSDHQEAVVIKYDPAGNELWVRTKAAPNQADYRTLCIVSTNSIYVAGTLDNNGVQSAAISRFNASGTEQWTQYLTGNTTNGNSIEKLIADASGNIYAATLLNFVPLGRCAGVTKFNARETILWQKNHPGQDGLDSGFLAEGLDTSGQFYLALMEQNAFTVDNTPYVRKIAVTLKFNPNQLINPAITTWQASPTNGSYSGWYTTQDGTKRFDFPQTISATNLASGIQLIQSLSYTDGDSKWVPQNLYYFNTSHPTFAKAPGGIDNLVPSGMEASVFFNCEVVTVISDSQDEFLLATNNYSIHKPTPIIDVQPTSLTLPIGTNATFSVIAEGVGTLRYQWNYNGQPISGATNQTLRLFSIGPAQNGPYTVTVSDMFDNTLSWEARLTVYPISDPISIAWENVETSQSGDNTTLAGIEHNDQALWVVANHTVWDIEGISTKSAGYFLELLDPNGQRIARAASAIDETAISTASAAASVWTLVQKPTGTKLIKQTGTNLTPEWTWTSAQGGVQTPLVLALGTNQSAAVVLRRDTSTNQTTTVQVLSPAGAPLWAWSTNYQAAKALAVWQANNIFVALLPDTNTTLPSITVQLPGSPNANSLAIPNWDPSATPTAITSDQTNVYLAFTATNTTFLAAIAPNGTTPWVTTGNLSANWTPNTLATSPDNYILAAGSDQEPSTLNTDQAWTSWNTANGALNWETTTAAQGGPDACQYIRATGGKIYTLGTIYSAQTAQDAQLNRFGADGTFEWGTTLSADATFTSDVPAGWAMDTNNNIYIAVSSASQPDSNTILLYKLAANPLPLITKQPSSTTAGYGSTVFFSVQVSGESPIFYQWYFNNFILDGQTSATLGITNVGPANAGTYRVVVQNQFGTAQSTNATLTVSPKPTIIANPASVTGYPDDPLLLSVSAGGQSPLYFQWFLNGTRIPNGTTTSISYPSISGNTGAYWVVITNSSGSITSLTAQVSIKQVAPPSFTQQPTNASARPGASAAFIPTVTGERNFMQWWFNQTAIPGATNLTYQITNAALANEGQYRLTVTNFAGRVTSAPAAFTLTIQAPTITKQPQSTLALYTGSATNLAITATGDLLQYQWRFNSTNLSSIVNPTALTPNLWLTNFDSLNQAGRYDVVVSNRSGSVTSQVATITRLLKAPTFSVQPTNCSVAYGSNITLYGLATGDGPITYQWFKFGYTLVGATNNSLFITNAQASDGTTYILRASNAAGYQNSSTITLTVTGNGPLLTLQPTNICVPLGTNFTLAVAATGPQLTYQWYKNGTTLVGSINPTLTLTMSTNRVGSYFAKISNPWGSTNSVTVTVSIPVPSTPVHLALTSSGSGLSLTITGTPGDTWNIEQSTDLATWAPLTNVVINPAGSTNIVIPANTNPKVFLRGHH